MSFLLVKQVDTANNFIEIAKVYVRPTLVNAYHVGAFLGYNFVTCQQKLRSTILRVHNEI